jgi:hypothetical protein
MSEPTSKQGVDPAGAVFVGGTYPAWVVPGTSKVCLVVDAIGAHGVPSASCGTVAQGEAGLVRLLTVTETGAPVVVGLVPNGNVNVAVTDASGAAHDVPVAHNVYEITSGSPSTVSFNDASGATTTESVVMPATP